MGIDRWFFIFIFLCWFGRDVAKGFLKVVWWLDFWWWKKYGECLFLFFFLSGSGLTMIMLQTDRCLL